MVRWHHRVVYKMHGENTSLQSCLVKVLAAYFTWQLYATAACLIDTKQLNSETISLANLHCTEITNLFFHGWEYYNPESNKKTPKRRCTNLEVYKALWYNLLISLFFTLSNWLAKYIVKIIDASIHYLVDYQAYLRNVSSDPC